MQSWIKETQQLRRWDLDGFRLERRELSSSRLRRWSTAASGWDGRSLGAAGGDELKRSRLRRWELGGSGLGWRQLINSKLGQRKLGGFRLRSLVQPYMVSIGFRIQRTEGAQQLRVEAEGAQRFQEATEKAPPLPAENEEARLLQVVRRGSANSD